MCKRQPHPPMELPKLNEEFIFLDRNRHRFRMCWEQGYEERFLRKRRFLKEKRSETLSLLVKGLVSLAPGLIILYRLIFSLNTALFTIVLICTVATPAIIFLLEEIRHRFEANSYEQ